MNTSPLPSDPHILLTGATGYVGGRLLSRFESDGRRVRCLVRRPHELADRATERITFHKADLLDAATLPSALEGIDVAYYMVHSMGSSADFEDLDQKAATQFADAARAAGVKRIIYLGGLGEEDESLSPHLASRQEVGRLLKRSEAQVIEFRAGVVLGSGSLSFELIRALVERLPIMITPRWVRVESQPILITDVLAYLRAALETPDTESRVFEIGGADRSTYGDLMRAYGEQRGLRRWMVGVPFLTPRLSSLWLGLVTPVYARVGRKLIGSIKNPTVVTDDAARRAFPDIHPVGLEESMRRVLAKEDAATVETRWCDAVSSGGQAPSSELPEGTPRLLDHRSCLVSVPPAKAFAPIRRIGGARGWYFASWLWRVRGFLDLLVGGVGLRRGRRDPETVRVGEPLDFWRVEAYEADARLVLRAEMKVPGKAWLEFQVNEEEGGSRINQTAIFDARGVLGRLYWWSVLPLHGLIFGGMLRRIAAHAEAQDTEAQDTERS